MASIEVYIRKGPSANERWVSFRIPSHVPQSEILDQGWAFDGNQVLLSVPKRELRDKQVELRHWLRSKGYDEVRWR